MLVQTINAISAALPEPARAAGPRPARPPRDRPAAAAEQPALGLHPGRAAPADRAAARLRVRPPVRAHAARQGRARDLRPADSRSQFLEAFHNLLHLASIFYKEDDDTTVIADAFPVLNALKRGAPAARRGRAQPVRRPALDGAPGDAHAAVAAGPAGDARVPADARRWSPTRSRGWTAVDAMKRLQGWTDVVGPALPRPRGVRRADPAVDPLRQLERRQRPRPGGQLGALLAAGDPVVHPRLPGGDRRRPDRRRVDTTMPAVHLQRRLAEQLQGRRQTALDAHRLQAQLSRPAASQLGARQPAQLPSRRRAQLPAGPQEQQY